MNATDATQKHFNKIESTFKDYQNKIDNIPDYSDFIDERKEQKITEYKNSAFNSAAKMFNIYENDIIKDSEMLKDKISDIKYPLTKSNTTANQQNVESIKLRTENIALSKLQPGILNLIQSNFESKNYDFVYYLKEALNNLAERSELTNEIMQVYDAFDEQLGVTSLENGLIENKKVLKKLEIYKELISDPSNPQIKLKLIQK